MFIVGKLVGFMEKNALTVCVVCQSGLERWRGGVSSDSMSAVCQVTCSALLFNHYQGPMRQILLFQFLQMRNLRLRLVQGCPVSRW